MIFEDLLAQLLLESLRRILESSRSAEQSLIIGRSTTLRADMRGVADQQLVRRKICLQLFLHFTERFRHDERALLLNTNDSQIDTKN